MRSKARGGGLLLLLVALALMLSGCVHVDRDLRFNGDGSGAYTLTLGLASQLVSLDSEAITTSMDQFGEKVKQEGGSYRRFEQDGYSNWEYTRPFKSVDELNKLLRESPDTSAASPTGGDSAAPVVNSDTLAVSQTPGFFSNSFRVTGQISMKDTSGTSTDNGGIDVSTYMKDARKRVTITMPGWITSHQGGEVNGNTVTYTIHYNQEATIDVVGGGINPTAVALTGGGILVVILLIAGVVVLLLVRRKRAQAPALAPVTAGAYSSASSSASSSAPSMPGAYGTLMPYTQQQAPTVPMTPPPPPPAQPPVEQ